MQDLLRVGVDSFGHIDEFALDSRTRPNEPNTSCLPTIRPELSDRYAVNEMTKKLAPPLYAPCAVETRL